MKILLDTHVALWAVADKYRKGSVRPENSRFLKR